MRRTLDCIAISIVMVGIICSGSLTFKNANAGLQAEPRLAVTILDRPPRDNVPIELPAPLPRPAEPADTESEVDESEVSEPRADVEVTEQQTPVVEPTPSVPSTPLAAVIPEPMTPAPTPSLSVPGDAHEFLALHNEVREEHSLTPLAWSDSLAAGAAEWADVLQGEQCEMRHSGLPYGENLFTLWTNNESVEGTPEDAVTWWADEESYYDLASNTCEDGEMCGHYTQMVWETTTEVGCAQVRCADDEGHTDLFVCRYSPQGNIIGKRPYDN